jgi:hypothetical protein
MSTGEAVEIAARPKVVCADCGTEVAYGALACHRRARHAPDAPRFPCDAPDCGKVFKRRDDFGRHRVSHTAAELACAECAYRTTRPDNLERHRRRHQVESLERRFADIATATDALRAQLAQREREAEDLRSQPDKAHREPDEDDGNAAGLPAAPATPARARDGRCGACGVADAPALLGAVVRCSRPSCAARFHWTCAGYAYQLTSAHRLALCAACLEQARFMPETVERADREVVVLDTAPGRAPAAACRGKGRRAVPVPRAGGVNGVEPAEPAAGDHAGGAGARLERPAGRRRCAAVATAGAGARVGGAWTIQGAGCLEERTGLYIIMAAIRRPGDITRSHTRRPRSSMTVAVALDKSHLSQFCLRQG